MGQEEQRAGYAEVAAFLTEHLQLALRGEAQRTRLTGRWAGAAPRLLRHDEGAAGVNWWFTPQLVLKVSLHRSRGNRFVDVRRDPLPASDVTHTLFAGTQFSF